MDKKNKKIILIVLLTIVTLIIVGCSADNELNDTDVTKDAGAKMIEQNALLERTAASTEAAIIDTWDTASSSGEVMVDLTPKDYEEGKLFVEIGVNTHTVNNLDSYDLKEITSLNYRDDVYFPLQALSLSGHHNNGQLVFEIPEKPDHFTILIEDLHDPGNREFSW